MIPDLFLSLFDIFVVFDWEVLAFHTCSVTNPDQRVYVNLPETLLAGLDKQFKTRWMKR